jgi:glutaredoxin
MNKFGIIIIVATVLILGGGAYLLAKPAKPIDIPQGEANVYEYFWGNGCPHCEVVQDFLDSWDKKDTINLKKYEVWYDKTNAKIMEARYNSCSKKPQGQMSVPFLITPKGECLVGDEPIIELFKSL